MPSESARLQAKEALEAPHDRFRGAVATTLDEVRSILRGGEADGRVERVLLELGHFAQGRIDPERFSSHFEAGRALDPSSLATIQQAFETLSNVAERYDEVLSYLRLKPGEDLAEGVARGLATAGTAFGAARLVELARHGHRDVEAFPDFLNSFPFRYWNRIERQVAPPLIVELDGGDLQAGGLARFLDGGQKIVLLVNGSAPPAPLVRLITPGLFVMQTSTAEELEEIGKCAGPAIAALLPEGAATFVHRPVDGEIWERLEVRHLPERARGSVGSISHHQQEEELEQLRLLASISRPAPAPSANGGAPADPADRLASWLLTQAELDGPQPEAG
jgi:hypothetical protein